MLSENDREAIRCVEHVIEAMQNLRLLLENVKTNFDEQFSSGNQHPTMPRR